MSGTHYSLQYNCYHDNKYSKRTVAFGALSIPFFCWQQAGLLNPKAAWPSFVVIALLAGLEIGRSALRGGNT